MIFSDNFSILSLFLSFSLSLSLLAPRIFPSSIEKKKRWNRANIVSIYYILSQVKHEKSSIKIFTIWIPIVNRSFFFFLFKSKCFTWAIIILPVIFRSRVLRLQVLRTCISPGTIRLGNARTVSRRIPRIYRRGV